MADFSILSEAIEAMQSIQGAMAAIASFWKQGAEGIEGRKRIKNEVEYLEESYCPLREIYKQCREYVILNWNDFVTNSFMMAQIEALTDACRTFNICCRNFEDAFCEAGDEALLTFNDVWIARKFFVFVYEKRMEDERICRIALEDMKKTPVKHRPFRGISRAFSEYFHGLNDSDIEKLVNTGDTGKKPVKWLGSRCEAVLFAEHFGLRAVHMNRSFIFPGRNKEHRDLNLSSEYPTNARGEYRISSRLDMYLNWKV